MSGNITEKWQCTLVQVIMLWEMPSLKTDNRNYSDSVCHDFVQSFQANAWIVSQIGPQLFCITSLSVQYSLVITYVLGQLSSSWWDWDGYLENFQESRKEWAFSVVEKLFLMKIYNTSYLFTIQICTYVTDGPIWWKVEIHRHCLKMQTEVP